MSRRTDAPFLNDGHLYSSPRGDPRRSRHLGHPALLELVHWRNEQRGERSQRAQFQSILQRSAISPRCGDDGFADCEDDVSTEGRTPPWTLIPSLDPLDGRHPYAGLPHFSWTTIVEIASKTDPSTADVIRSIPETRDEAAIIAQEQAARIIEEAQRQAEQTRHNTDAHIATQQARIQDEWTQLAEGEQKHRDNVAAWDACVEEMSGTFRRTALDQLRIANDQDKRAKVLDAREAALSTGQTITLQELHAALQQNTKTVMANNAKQKLSSKLVISIVIAIVVPIALAIWEYTVSYVKKKAEEALKDRAVPALHNSPDVPQPRRRWWSPFPTRKRAT